jgi:BirA family biotin operon repressor/biotin-[acetyl-CoA-carboxylase] ligase
VSAAPVRLPPGYSLIALDKVGSTNAEALRRAAAGAPAGTVVWARLQTEGRGRRGRLWVSPPGNLYCSVVFRFSRAPAAQLSYVAAVALADTLAERAPAGSVRLKWPNDVLLKGGKVSGILLEGGADASVVLGTGVNVASHPADQARTPAPTSLAAQHIDASVEDVLKGYLDSMSRWVEQWQRDGFAPVRAAWLARAVGIGEAIEVRLPTGTVPGRFTGLDDDGVLIVATADGTRRFAAGDVFLLTGERPHAARH